MHTHMVLLCQCARGIKLSMTVAFCAFSLFLLFFPTACLSVCTCSRVSLLSKFLMYHWGYFWWNLSKFIFEHVSTTDKPLGLHVQRHGLCWNRENSIHTNQSRCMKSYLCINPSTLHLYILINVELSAHERRSDSSWHAYIWICK